MMIPKRDRPDRRGAAMLEAAVVYPVTMLLLIGTVVLGIAVFRYEQVQSLAREGARYASVHGPTYASEQNASYATNATVLSYLENNFAVGMQSSDLSCTVTWSPSPPTASPPSTVTVQLSYSWVPEAYFKKQAVSLTASSSMPVTY
jgi:Flp pilus assembly protein TadG